MQSSCKSYVYLFSVLVSLSYLTTGTATPSPLYSRLDNLLLNCGSSASSTDPDGKEWTGDASSNFNSSQLDQTSAVSNSNSQATSTNHVPYTTARIFVSPFTYTFVVSPGPKLIRFYFYPARYQGFDMFKANFTVTAGPFTLLSNFNASLAADSLGSEILVKEFCVNVEHDQRLNITFTPSRNADDDAYAFVNGIEIVNSSAGYSNAILNRLELFELKNSDANLAGYNPKVLPPSSGPKKQHKKALLFLVTFGSSLGIVTVLLLMGLTIFCLRRRAKSHKNQTSADLEGLCRRFTLKEIRTATNNFDRNLVVGKGGSGQVFKGYIDDELTPVAVKIFGPTSTQGYHEFRTEIEMLSKLHHPHLVPLVGYCNDERFMIIVYEFMAHGTLRDRLYDTDNPPLSWKERLEICIGAARGLLYLHEGAERAIIHRDVKPSNILVDEDWVARVSDFGLSRLGPTSLSRSHVTTGVRGTFGYIDPGYVLTSELTLKSDVYGFGVVLFEVLCARPPVAIYLEDEEKSLAERARQCFKDGRLEDIIDRRLMGQIAPACLKVYAKIAYRCLCENRRRRPKMAEVLVALEHAMELQEIADAGAHAVMIDEEAPLFGERNLVVSGPANHRDLLRSCPIFWERSVSSKKLLRFFSDRALKWVKSPKPGGLKTCCFGASDARPHVQVQISDLSCCGPYTTPAKTSN